ncbi:MAG: M14 family zinc carboxypeptidase [Planctomycetota bacterium]
MPKQSTARHWMRANTIRFVGHTLLAAVLMLGSTRVAAELPDVLTTSTEMVEQLNRIVEADPRFTVETIGQSVEGKDLLAVRVMPKARMAIRWKVLLIGAQHGHEHAGKEAILELLDDIASGEAQLPPGVELWAVPMANPDGVDKDQRRNANDFDLNRDHLILSQPETVALHKLVQRVRPHVIVDCHEFTRDSKSYTDKGWGEWPLIMMDGANSPLLPKGFTDAALRWVDDAEPAMRKAGFNYRRYTVGGPPPDRELRYSTLDPDDARNGLSFYGGMGFIIESGIKRSAEDPQADLSLRVAAYRMLLEPFLHRQDLRHPDSLLLSTLVFHRGGGRTIVTNAMWAQVPQLRTWPDIGPRRYPVIDLETGEDDLAVARNYADTVVIKRRIKRPFAYAILPAHADAYADLLNKHAVTYERLDASKVVSAELATLVRIEEDFDPIYERYGGRQIVTVETQDAYEIPEGSLWIELDQLLKLEPWTPENPNVMMPSRAIKVLEPQQLYGLYQWPQWRATVGEDGLIPVVRVMAE